MKTKAVENAKQMNESNKRTLKTAHEKCSKVSSEMKQLQASLRDNKTSGKEREIFITVKKAKSLADDEKNTKVLTVLRKLKRTCTFKRNEEIETALFKNTLFGTFETTRSVSSLQHLRDIKIKTLSDVNKCSIAGCSFIPPDKVLLADQNNNKLKLFDINNDRLIKERQEPGGPRGVGLMSQDEVAVAMRKMNAVQIFKTYDDLSLVRTVQLDRQCYNVTYNQGKLYVGCWDPGSVLVLDLNGTVQKEIPLKTATIQMDVPAGIAVSADSKYVYVSDSFVVKSNIVRLTTNGNVASIYKDENIHSPSGIISLEDGSLLVCCLDSNTVYRISEDFKTRFNVLNDIASPRRICIDYNSDKIYIGCANDTLKVCKVVYQK
jgi:DNA-binding beta-propeller fold protein YncE